MTWKQAVIEYLPWLLSLITIVMTVMQGNLHRHAWALGLINQCLWLAWTILAGVWGLLPLNLALWVVYWRNHRRWRRMARSRDAIP